MPAIQPTAFRVTVGTSPVILAQNTGSWEELDVMVRDTDATLSIFLGDSGVTTSTGFEVRFSETATFGLRPGQIMYAISAGSVVVDVIQRVSQ